MRFLVSVGVPMDYGRYVPIEASTWRKALKAAVPYAKKNESVYEIRWDIPEWFKTALGDSCNQVFWDAYSFSGDINDWYNNNRPLSESMMDKLEIKLLKLHEEQIAKWGAKALEITIKEFAKNELDLEDQFTKDHCCGNVWMDLVAACHHGNSGGSEKRTMIALSLCRKVAAPISELLKRAYYGKALYGTWKNRQFSVTL